ncbi:hypothetical protein ACQPZQ_15805 [Pseudonocardia sp. CA-142604]|uniref:hypothetical protein n=1 Tax=Pseudonocardia sp. CA-142604 TaxID=3240024 RepID=UPI003D8FF26D
MSADRSGAGGIRRSLRIERTLRYATVEGSVTRTEPGTDEHLLEMGRRYLPAECRQGGFEVGGLHAGAGVVEGGDGVAAAGL